MYFRLRNLPLLLLPLSTSTQNSRFRFKAGAILSLLCAALPQYAQSPIHGAPEVRQALDRLNTLGSVLMIAAHPDDERNELIAYLARARHYRTAYLSLTRGDGGQNLIGSEQGALIGVIRTQELLGARRVDGGEQYFTRAIDFGFSKTAAETMEKWGREQILADIVWVIRKFQPDTIVLCFSGTPRDGHGHHQTSAILGKEAFRVAADPNRLPEQLRWVRPWQAKRVMHATFAFNREQEQQAAQTAGRLEIPVGDYNPMLGFSYAEIGAISRSQHKSQGFGFASRRGAQRNFLTPVDGEPASKDLFDGIDTSWNRLAGGAAVGKLLDEARSAYSPSNPEKTVALLAQARPLIQAIRDPWAELKLRELDETIALATGLWLDFTSNKAYASPGGDLQFSITAINRSALPVKLLGVRIEGAAQAPTVEIAPAVLAYNQPAVYPVRWRVPADQPYTHKYWLEKPAQGTLFNVQDPALLGLADNPPVLEASFRLEVGGQVIELKRPVIHRYSDRVLGELTRPLVIAPAVVIDVPETPLVFADAKAHRIDVPVRATTGKASGQLTVEAPAGWRVDPPSQPFLLAEGEQAVLNFTVTPPVTQGNGALRATAIVDGRRMSLGMTEIAHAHIPAQTVFRPAEIRLVRTDIRTLSKNIGYVSGAGDEVPGALKQIGCEVTLLSADDLARGDLSRYDAIVLGVRAFNTRADVRANAGRLYEFAQNGGTVVVQYNVMEGGFMGGDPKLLERIGPYPIQLSRDRVTVEDSPVVLLKPDHPLLSRPNRITEADFTGWVQERGLYFAQKWDTKYETVIASHDPGEEPMPGGMLYARMGKGAYVFTAYSWFRQLPAGVPGAYRLFANLISAGKAQ
jgi:LmbE family N-acetylglucosaminyl deacetylase